MIQFNEQMRGATGWQRKRSARSAPRIKQAQAALMNERALLDRALAGERTAFEVLADTRLTGLRNVIFELLTERGGQPSDDEIDQALGTTLQSPSSSWSASRNAGRYTAGCPGSRGVSCAGTFLRERMVHSHRAPWSRTINRSMRD